MRTCLVALALASFGLSCSSDDAGRAPAGTGGSAGATDGAAGGDIDAGVETGPAAYAVPVFDAVRISSDAAQTNFQQAAAEFDFGTGPFTKVTLVVDLGTTCYPFDSWKDNPPPAGQNWPADCDAFDRNFELSLDPPADEKIGPPALELVRAITPFGGPLHLEVDVTDVANGRPGKHQLRVVIPTWSDAAGK